MKKFWFLSKLLLLSLFGVVTIVATSYPVPELIRFAIVTLNNGPRVSPDVEEIVFACLNEKVKLEWDVPDAENDVILTTLPSGNLSPGFENQQVEKSGALDMSVLGGATVTLKWGALELEIALELLSEDICTGFPLNLIADFEGTLEQTSPEVASLARRLNLRWQGNALQTRLTDTVVNEYGSYGAKGLANCQVFPAEDKLICLEGNETNPRLRLEGTITAEGFVGSYKGFERSATGSRISFEGTFDFKKVQ